MLKNWSETDLNPSSSWLWILTYSQFVTKIGAHPCGYFITQCSTETDTMSLVLAENDTESVTIHLMEDNV